MLNEKQQRIYDRLRQLHANGLEGARQLFCAELGYDPADEPLADHDDGLRGFAVADADGYVLFFGRPSM